MRTKKLNETPVIDDILHLRSKAVWRGLMITEVWLGPKQRRQLKKELNSRFLYLSNQPSVDRFEIYGMAVRYMIEDGIRVGHTIE